MIKVTVTVETDHGTTTVERVNSGPYPLGAPLVLPVLAAAFRAAATPHAHEIPILRSAMQTLVAFVDSFRPEDFT